eukprot:12586-Heterococcus_DN1.PRE.2
MVEHGAVCGVLFTVALFCGCNLVFAVLLPGSLQSSFQSFRHGSKQLPADYEYVAACQSAAMRERSWVRPHNRGHQRLFLTVARETLRALVCSKRCTMALMEHVFVAIIVIAALNLSSEAFLSSCKVSTTTATGILQSTGSSTAAAAAWPDDPGAKQLARQQLITGVMSDAAAELRTSKNNYKEVLIDMGRWVEGELRSTLSAAAVLIEPDKPLQPAAAAEAALPPPAAAAAITAPLSSAQPAASLAEPAMKQSEYVQPAYAQPVQRQSVGVDLAAWQRSTQSTAPQQQRPAVFVGYSLVDDHTDWHSLRQGCDEILMAAQRRVVSQQRGQQAGAADYTAARSSSYSSGSYSGSSYYTGSYSSVSPVSTGSSATANYRPPAVALSCAPAVATASISSSSDSSSYFRDAECSVPAAALPASWSLRSSSASLFSKASRTGRAAAKSGQALPAMFTAATDTAVPNSSAQSDSIMLKRMQRTVPKKAKVAAAAEAPWEREFREQGSAVLQRMRRSGSSSDNSSSNSFGSSSSSSSSSSSYERAVERPMWGYSDSTEAAAPVRRSSSSSPVRVGSSVGRGAFSLAALRSADPDARRWQ